MLIKDIIQYLDSRFLPVYQEDYDNSGFLLGDKNEELRGVLVTLDVTPEVIDEAILKECNLIVSHHPMIYSGMKRITPGNETGRMVMSLISNGISVYAAHTNLDNMAWGVSGALAEKLGLQNCRVLRPIGGVLRKLVTFVPLQHAENVRQALFAAGAGNIGGYDHCSWNCDGTGSFRAGNECNPFCGKIGSDHHEAETRIEVICEQRQTDQLIDALMNAHPYEEPAFDIIPLDNSFAKVGAGMVGSLPHPVDTMSFIEMVKQQLNLPVIRCSSICKEQIHTVALCGGSGSFLISDAKKNHADIFLTGDLKYHDFQAAENDIILADVGHYESEQFAKDVIHRVISEKFTNFACQISEKNHGYVNYI